MRFIETRIPGAFIVDIEPRRDERGFFARSWCRDEFRAAGLEADLAQCSISYNATRGTLRGMHYQAAPHGEAKLVRCTAGAIHDVIVDLRPGSPTFCQWVATELTASSHRMLYVPDGLAHGFQTLEDGSEVFYQMSVPYHASSARGVRWNDPAFDIAWPLAHPLLSERDRSYPDFEATHVA
ncbi:MAG TPA: dTDP-4-dehydrorhamnose 3,5-epimerase [Gemmatimonadaceae bacterium]|jgi:dTDP-4-dehydrorhamnose 3,5-epimerase|nr:dTDP-4-dehydrorhamnose 3,5-epimerase [Gemmatimonadaceae bacterium]